MLNEVIIMGRLTTTPELKSTQSGKNVIAFNIACDRDFGEKETDFINCVAWQQKAEFISRYFKKGSMIAITGRLTTRSYETENGKRVATEVVVKDAYFGESKRHDEGPKKLEDGFTAIEEALNDDLPF